MTKFPPEGYALSQSYLSHVLVLVLAQTSLYWNSHLLPKTIHEQLFCSDRLVLSAEDTSMWGRPTDVHGRLHTTLRPCRHAYVLLGSISRHQWLEQIDCQKLASERNVPCECSVLSVRWNASAEASESCVINSRRKVVALSRYVAKCKESQLERKLRWRSSK